MIITMADNRYCYFCLCSHLCHELVYTCYCFTCGCGHLVLLCVQTLHFAQCYYFSW